MGLKGHIRSWHSLGSREFMSAFYCFVAFFAGSGVQLAHSSSAAGGPEAERLVPWADESKYQSCGQSCTYQKGNENLSVQATYIMEKVQALRQEMDKPFPDEQMVRDSLGTFCRDGEVVGDCVNRFILAQTSALYKMRQAIGNNDSVVGDLSDGSRGEQSAAVWKERKDALSPQVPEVLKLKQIEEDLKFRTSITNGYEEWAKQLPRKPEFDDFTIFKQLPRDPSNPAAGSMSVVDKSTGAQKIQKKRYDEAMKKYNDKYALVQAEWDTNHPGNDKPSTKSVPVITQLDKDAYTRARRLMVFTINKALGDLKSISNRKPGSLATKPKGQGATQGQNPADNSIDHKARLEKEKAAATYDPQNDPRNDPRNDEISKTTKSKGDVMTTVNWAPDDLEKQVTGDDKTDGDGVVELIR